MGILDAFGGIFGNVASGFMAANETRKIVLQDSALFLYPVVAVILDVILIALILFVFVGISLLTAGKTINLFGWYVGLAVAYIVVAYVTTFFVVAMLLAFREFTKGNKIGLGQGVGMAMQYATLIFEWVVFYFVIQVLIDVIEMAIQQALRRFGSFGNIISSMITGALNLALAVATLFAIPVIIDEKTNPIDTIKLSGKFIIKNWGQTLGGFAYSEIIQLILSACGALLFVIAGLAMVSALGIPISLSNILWTVIFGIVGLVLIFALAMSPVGSAILFVVMTLLAASTSGTASAVVVFLLTGLGMLLVMAGHIIKYVLFYCFRLIIYDYKTRGTLPKSFDKKVIESSTYFKSASTQSQSGGWGGMTGGGGGYSGGGSSGGKSADPFS